MSRHLYCDFNEFPQRKPNFDCKDIFVFLHTPLSYISTEFFLLPIRILLLTQSLVSRSFNEKTDIYSFGVVMWEIFSLGDLPFAELSNEEVHEKVSLLGNLHFYDSESIFIVSL